MTWDPSITQRVRKAIGNSTDRTLVTDVLERGIKECEEEIGHMRKRIKMLEDGHRERLTETGVNRLIDTSQKTEKLGLVEKAFRLAIIPLAAAALGFLADRLGKH